MKNTHLLIIDPQNDFREAGALPVLGASMDLYRLSTLIKKRGGKINQIHVTLDSHRLMDIAHPIFWLDQNGEHPKPFTIITYEDVQSGRWTTSNPALLKRGMEYVEQLADNGRYPLCIWTPHCLIGSRGHAIVTNLFEALCEWENQDAMINYIHKGTNIFTEHYSAIQADVPDLTDQSTMLNMDLIRILQTADVIAIAGEAKSHCVANTVTDLVNNIGEDHISKIVLLEDCTSNVEGFEELGEKFVKDMVKRGMKISNSEDFLR